MKFKIPFTFLNIQRLKNNSKFFTSRIPYKKESKLKEYLKNSEIDLSREEYLGIVFRNFVFNTIFLFVIISILLIFRKFAFNYSFYAFGGSILFSFFILFSQIVYPKIYLVRKERVIEKNLISALEDILIQLNSGIPLYDILVNVSEADYGVLSEEFKLAVRRISSGEQEALVLEELGKKSTSVFFKRTLWQISNSMNAGSDMAIVIKDSIKNLNEEQLIQVQDYGNKLNPLIVLYMLVSVVIPALSVTFLTILASMLGLSKNIVTILFVTLLIFNIIFQVLFLGLIKSKRPSLM